MHSKKTAVTALNRFSVTDWRDDVELAAKDMVTASKRVLDLVMAARSNVHEDTVRDALQHAFGEAYADLNGVPFEQALTAKSVKNRVSDGMAVFKAVNLPPVMPGNLQHAAAECRKLNKKAKAEPANDETLGNQSSDVEDQERHEPEGLGLSQPVDAAHMALRAMITSLNVLKGAAKSATLASLIEDLGDLVEEIGNELDASE